MRRLRLPAILAVALALAAPLLAQEAPPTADAMQQQIDRLKAWDDGQSQAVPNALQLAVVRYAADPARRADAAARLASLLPDPQATEAAKRFVLRQLLVVGGEAQVPALAALVADLKLGDMARRSLEAIPGEAAGRALRDAGSRLRGYPLAGLAVALGNRRDAEAVPLLVRLLTHEDPPVPPAAVAALGAVGTAEAAAALLRAPSSPQIVSPLGEAILRCAARRAADGDAAGAEALYEKAWSSFAPFARRWPAVVGLARLDPAKAAPRIAEALAAADPADRAAALRGTLRLADDAKDEAARVKLLNSIQGGGKTAEAKKRLLAELAEIPSAGALLAAASLFHDADAGADAAAAARQIGKMLALQDRNAAGTALQEIAKRETTATFEALRDEILSGPALAGGPADRKRSEARKRQLGQAAPAGHRIVCYLDCGPDTSDGVPKGPALGLVAGDTWIWEGAPAPGGSVFYAGDRVLFEASGLNPRKSYQLGFAWWDYDKNGRVQSVRAADGKSGRETTLLDKTPLPPGTEKPAERVVPIPRELHSDGKLRLSFRREAASNAAVSEVWLFESEVEGAALPFPAASPAAVPAAPPAAAGRPSAPTKKADRSVLVVTGIDYPGHKWKETAPVLVKALDQDPRLGVSVVEDFRYLASPDLMTYDAVVLHYMPWEVPPPSKACQDGLKAYVESGKGLVLVHFACGAFPGWDEFVKIAGRAYDKKLRGHDPHGTFRVNIVKPDHPVVKGMESFDTVDELYTCLGGDTPVEVLASSTSKVDKKEYAMAFVLQVGKGRVFHSPLGHDVKAFPAPVGELFRRGTAWAAGLPPTP
jgi:type 1 glutamine amidotransferase